MSATPNYVSLFSSAGLGCFGLKLAGFDCVGTAELLGKRLDVQRANNVAADKEAYYNIDLTNQENFLGMLGEIESRLAMQSSSLDLLVATPPCQGMSVANHKKGNELPRNSLVIKSIEAVLALEPQVFVFENVRSFLTSACLDLDGEYRTIREAIERNLSARYNIIFRVVNLKDYGSPSSRTRTLVIGSKVQNIGVIPDDFFPDKHEAPTLEELIGHLPRLKEMGEISESDIYHAFRSYDSRMQPWIAATGYGKSAFDNEIATLRPHQVKDGTIQANTNKNGDKYQRQRWENVAPCVHTRNDILASQNTVHPEDDRVFSIRELMLMMGVPEEFKWAPTPDLNKLAQHEKVDFLKKHEINIRQCLGEGVPTPVFEKIGIKYLDLKKKSFVRDDWSVAVREEKQNPRRTELSAFYTNPAAVHALLSQLPPLRKKSIRVLEPSCGNGAMAEQIIGRIGAAYPRVELILSDIDPDALDQARSRVAKLVIPDNVTVKFICGDFLSDFDGETFDLIIANPPYGKFKTGENLFVTFLKKARELSATQAFIIPKAFLNAHEYSEVRSEVRGDLHAIVDLGELCFVGVLIETICIVLTDGGPTDVNVISWPTGQAVRQVGSYITDPEFPSWLPYRNPMFDQVAQVVSFDSFHFFRDRSLRKADRLTSADRKLVRSKNITMDGQLSGPFFEIEESKVPQAMTKFIGNGKNVYVAPNLTYYPRVIPLPNSYLTDGSCALLRPKHPKPLTDREIAFFKSEPFFRFYRIAMNYSTRSLNIDKVSGFYWGRLHESAAEEWIRARVSGPRELADWVA